MIARGMRRLVESWDRLLWSLWLWKFRWGTKCWGADFQQRQIRNAPERYLPEILLCLGATVHQTATIKAGLRFDNLSLTKRLTAVEIGAKAYLGPEVFLDLAAAIRIEDEAVLAPQAMVLTHGDVGDRMLAAQIRRKEGPVVLRQGCWIGARAIILPGVTVGKGAVVGAGAVVTHDVPDFTMVAGVPARQLLSIKGER